MKKYILVFCLMFLSSLSFANLSVRPSVINVSGVPGSSYKNVYFVTSKYNMPVTVKITLSNGNSYSGNEDVDVNDWLKIEKTEFEINPGETVEVPYEVNIKPKMKGSVCGKVDFAANQSSMINLSILLPIYVIVEGTENINFEIDSLNLTQSDRDKNLIYNMVVKNTGNVHIRHSGQIQIFDSKKKEEIKRIDIEETVPTYCESSRTFIDNIGAIDEGTYVAVFTINALGKQVKKEIKFKVEKDNIEVIKSLWDKLKTKWKEFIKIFQS